MYKFEVKHQHNIRRGQGYATKYYLGELPAGMFQFAVMFTESFTPLGCISDLAEQRGQKAEGDSQDGALRSEKISNQ